MSSLDEYSAFREQLYSGGSGGQIVIGTPDEKVRRRGLIIGIIIMIVVIILLVLFFLLVRKKKTTTSSGSTGTTGTTGSTGTTPTKTVPCGGSTNGVGCTGGLLCNTSSGQCVSCLVKADCPGAETCNTSTFTCQQCVMGTDCAGGVCDSGICCSPAIPVITSITTIMSTNSSFTINYTYAQTGASTQVEVTLQTPSGTTLSLQLVPATGSATFSEGTLGLHNSYLFPNTSYQVLLRIKYSCVTITNVYTNYTAPTSFTMSTCSTPLIPYMNIINASGNPAYDSYNGVAITYPTASTSFPIGVLISATSGIHPNLAETYYAQINTTVTTGQSCIPLQGCTTYYSVFAEVPYGGGVGTTYYYRYFNLVSNQCISPLSSDITFVRTF